MPGIGNHYSILSTEFSLEVVILKKLISLLLFLAVAAAFPAAAYASGDDGLALLSYDSWDEYNDNENDINAALIDKVYSEWKGDGLPFWCWYDIDHDGVYEVIVDSGNGKRGVETVNSKMLNNMGSKLIITKGDFSVYYWDYEAQKVASLKISSNNMFLSVSPEGYIVASSASGNSDSYSLYGYYPQSTRLLSETYTLSYSGRNLNRITIKDSFGKPQTVDEEEEWSAFLKLNDILSHSAPLVFYQTS